MNSNSKEIPYSGGTALQFCENPSLHTTKFKQAHVCRAREESFHSWWFKGHGQRRMSNYPPTSWSSALDLLLKGHPNRVQSECHLCGIYQPSRGNEVGCLEGSKPDSLVNKLPVQHFLRTTSQDGQLAGGLSPPPGPRAMIQFNQICQNGEFQIQEEATSYLYPAPDLVLML